jgi:hypothetical protein
VNRLFVERYWPKESPIGKRVKFGRESDNPWLTIVGVVPNIVQDEIQEPLRPAVYVPLAQDPQQFMSLAVRAAGGDPMALAEPVRKTVLAIDRYLPLHWVRTLEEWIDMGRFRTNFLASLFGIFAVLGLILGGVASTRCSRTPYLSDLGRSGFVGLSAPWTAPFSGCSFAKA